LATEELIRSQYSAAVLKYPKLAEPQHIATGWLVAGSIDVIDDEGGYWDTYDVQIIIPDTYPIELPEVMEVGGKIKQSPDWHNTIYCCLTTKAIMFAEMRGEVTLEKWLTNYVHKYLGNHVLKLKTGDYASGEFEHGTDGIIHGYKVLFNTDSTIEVQQILKALCGKSTLSKNRICFCGSGKKIKRCFDIAVEKHQMNIPIDTLRRDLDEVTFHQRSKRHI